MTQTSETVTYVLNAVLEDGSLRSTIFTPGSEQQQRLAAAIEHLQEAGAVHNLVSVTRTDGRDRGGDYETNVEIEVGKPFVVISKTLGIEADGRQSSTV